MLIMRGSFLLKMISSAVQVENVKLEEGVCPLFSEFIGALKWISSRNIRKNLMERFFLVQ